MTGLLLLLIPLAFVIYTVYKGLNPTISMLIGALLVCVVEGINPMTGIIGSQMEPSTFVTGLQSACAMFFFVFIMANLFGQVYMWTGGAKSIANALTNIVVRNSTGFNAKMKAIYAFMAVSIVFGFGGLDAFVCVFTLLPIGLMMFEKYDIPRKLLPATLFAGVTTAVCCPGTPLSCGNILASMFLGTKTTAAFIPGLVGVIVIFACDVIYLYKAVKKAELNGEHFERGGANMPPDNGDEKLPHPLLALLPLLTVAIMNLVFGINVSVSLLAGVLVACVTMSGSIMTPESKFKPYLELGNKGIAAAAMTFVPMAIQMALATLIQATNGYAFLSEIFTNMATSTNALIAWATSASLSGFLAGNAIAGLQLSAGIFTPIAEQIGLSLPAAHRIGCFAISILDTIPINAAVISGLMTCGLTHKEGYMPIFRTTVLYIFFGMIAVIAMCMLFPGLATS
ncbi:MAG: hypothetical protein K6G40_01075 [Eubacterium sp.]|nr:hypothetical protein [Eubacterium sp.]